MQGRVDATRIPSTELCYFVLAISRNWQREKGLITIRIPDYKVIKQNPHIPFGRCDHHSNQQKVCLRVLVRQEDINWPDGATAMPVVGFCEL